MGHRNVEQQDFDWGAIFNKCVLALAIAMCFAWSQIAGWSVTGTMLADGGARRGVASTNSDVQATSLKQLREERALIGTPRAKGEVEADLDLELRRTSKQYPAGDGPKATKLRGELKKIERAAELDQQIPAAMKRYEDTPAIAAGDVDVDIPVGIAQRLGWVSADTKAEEIAKAVHFWFVVFIVGVMGFFATFGPRLVGIRHDAISVDLLWEKKIVWIPLIFLVVEAGMNATFGYRRAGGGFFNLSAYLQAMMFAGVAILGSYLPTRWGATDAPSAPYPFIDAYDWGPKRLPPSAERTAGGDTRHAAHTPPDDYRPDPMGGARMQPRIDAPDYFPPRPGVRPPHQQPQHHQAETNLAPHQQLTGAPITINFAQAPSGEAGASQSVPLVPQLPPPREPFQAAAGNHHQPHQAALMPPLETGPPVDRTAVRGRQDQLLLFKSACLVAAPGALVAAEDVYARYAMWAGNRAMKLQAFLHVFGELADVPETIIGNELHFADVSVRTTPALQQVSA